MRKHIAIWFAILTLVIGLTAGWFASARYSHRRIESYMMNSAVVDLDRRYRVLSELRAGDTNHAIKTLEGQMDGDILAFGSLLRAMPADNDRPAEMKLLRAVREYRATHPWTAGYIIDRGVADAFALVSTNQSQ